MFLQPVWASKASSLSPSKQRGEVRPLITTHRGGPQRRETNRTMENHLEILITVIKPGLLEKFLQFGSMFFRWKPPFLGDFPDRTVSNINPTIALPRPVQKIDFAKHKGDFNEVWPATKTKIVSDSQQRNLVEPIEIITLDGLNQQLGFHKHGTRSRHRPNMVLDGKTCKHNQWRDAPKKYNMGG